MNVAAQKPAKPVSPLTAERDKLSYHADEQGNRIPDFSYAGYNASEKPIPFISAKVTVPLLKGDATLRIQSAINYVSALPVNPDGFRGAVLLEKGTYQVDGALFINTSGVVLRGSGISETILQGAGSDRQTLITIAGKNDKVISSEVRIIDAYVPVNAMSLHVASAQNFKVGDMILIHRPSTTKWINDLGTKAFGGGVDALGWKPGQRDLFWDRKVVAINSDLITIDAPITTALDTTYGGGTIATYKWAGRISNVGVENLSCESTFDATNPKDEAHRWMAVTLENTVDAWVRRVTFQHFAGSAVAAYETTKRITVEDCKSLAPVSEIGGQRRYTFFTTGQQNLFQRCYAEGGYHDFAVGFCAAGPNAFIQCHSQQPYSFSGAIDSWASGTLFDIVNVDGNALRFGNRGQDAQGAGWAAANSVFYQCTAAIVDCYKPPTANNWAFGTWAQFSGDGYWAESNNSINPRSLFYAQLKDRIGGDAYGRGEILPLKTDASSSPPVKVAMELTALSVKPPLTLYEWIDDVIKRNSTPAENMGVKTMDAIGIKQLTVVQKIAPVQVKNGWLTRGSRILTGKRHEVSWWRGSVQGPFGLKDASPHITRFVPGRAGIGLTDDLNEVANWMDERKMIAIEHNYGLWYDRRRDDHERIRRMDGEVWAPFYELPFARSGQSSAWDGLSKYDLTKYNTWYWSRLKKFAGIADEKGLVLIHQNYFQHNIIEAGAHYADFPWRTANNINNTGFPEPPPYAGDKRIFLADQFYDVSEPVRRELHKAYIRKCLDNFSDNQSVIQFIGAEYTGPFHFVKFWLNTIAAWQKEKQKQPIIGLSTTKDVQDSVLADPALSAALDIIDIRYWHYQADGKIYAPRGGQNLAPRQHARLMNPKKTSFEQVYRAVREYREKYLKKAVMYSGESYDAFGWAVFMAGGSMAVIPVTDPVFLASASTMHAADNSTTPNQWVLKNAKNEYIIYTNASRATLDLSGVSGSFVVHYINPKDGSAIKKDDVLNGGNVVIVDAQKSGCVIWVSKR